MTSFDFLSGFNNIDPKFILDAIDLMQTVEASDAEKEIMNMENYTIHKKRTVRRSVLVAAAVIALLCAMCVGAYAVNLFGIRDAVMGSQIVSDHYVDGEYAGKKLDDGMTISMQGCIGSPEYEASREFNAFLSAYEANGYNGDALHQPLGDWGEAHRRVYNGLYTETLVNKFLEISGKYELKDSQIFSYDNLAYDSQIDAMAYCRRAEELFELYQRCANRRQVETICVNFLRMLESTKLSVNGHLYFVPRHNMEKVDIFEDFVAELSRLNRNQTYLMANSIYIIDDAKQRQKMTEEFYSAVKKEISEYQERADYFIKSGCQSPSVMDRWVLKIQSLEGKKQHYEDVLRRELDGLDDDFATLKLLSQELSFRAQTIRSQRAA